MTFRQCCGVSFSFYRNIRELRKVLQQEAHTQTTKRHSTRTTSVKQSSMGRQRARKDNPSPWPSRQPLCLVPVHYHQFLCLVTPAHHHTSGAFETPGPAATLPFGWLGRCEQHKINITPMWCSSSCQPLWEGRRHVAIVTDLGNPTAMKGSVIFNTSDLRHILGPIT